MKTNKEKLQAIIKTRDRIVRDIYNWWAWKNIFETEEKLKRIREVVIFENADEFFNSYEYYNPENANLHLQDDLDNWLISYVPTDELLSLRARYDKIQDYMADLEERFTLWVNTNQFGIRTLRNENNLTREEINFLTGDLSEEDLLNNI